jgi:hypothetical protein
MPVLDRPTVQGRRRIPLAGIEAIVAARLGPGRVRGNAQPAAFSRQVAMYLASHVGKWSTTEIGMFYNGRDHSTVSYAIARIRSLREVDETVDSIVSILMEELASQAEPIESALWLKDLAQRRACPSLLEDIVLDALAERIANLIIPQIVDLISAVASAGKSDSRPKEMRDETSG